MMLLLLLAAVDLTAQGHFYPDHPNNDAARYEGPVYGIKGGIVASRFYYTSEALSGLSHELLLKPSAGCFVELPLSRSFTIAVELDYQQRGDSIAYLFNGKQEQYRLMAHYVTARAPLSCYFPVSDRFKPYVFLSVEVGTPVAGEIVLKSPYHPAKTPISSANINKLYAGALGGAGLRFNIPLSKTVLVLKLDAAVNLGLLDTYSASERAGMANPLNIQAYTIKGQRLMRCLEGHLSIGFYINKPDACGWF